MITMITCDNNTRFGVAIGVEPFGERQLADELVGEGEGASKGEVLTRTHMVLLKGQVMSLDFQSLRGHFRFHFTECIY